MNRKGKKYRFYIDESGDHTFSHLDKEDRWYLGLTGVAIESEFYKSFCDNLVKLKRRFLPYDPDYPELFVLHRTAIINKRGPFRVLQDPEVQLEFDAAMLRFFAEMEYRIISVVIDKKSHVDRYGPAAFHPYHYCIAVLLERYAGLLHHLGGRGDVMAESRGTREERELKQAF